MARAISGEVIPHTMSISKIVRRALERLRLLLTEFVLFVLSMSAVIGALVFIWHYELLPAHWVGGLAFSLVLGTFMTTGFHILLRWWMMLSPKPRVEELRPVPGFLTGLVERLVFTVAVGLTATGEGPIAMVGWLGLKMASN